MVEASSSTIFVTKQSSTSHMESTSPATPSKTASPGNSTSATMGKEEKVSCVKYFDALWFCYSPAHQLKRYYVYGDVDDCLGHWNTLFACLKQKTKFKEEETPLLSNPNTLWDIRTCDEAKSFWKQEFSDNETERPKVFTDAKSAGV